MRSIILSFLLSITYVDLSAQSPDGTVCFEFISSELDETAIVERVRLRMELQARQLNLLCPPPGQFTSFVAKAKDGGVESVTVAKVFLEAWKHDNDVFDFVAILSDEMHFWRESGLPHRILTSSRTINWARNYREGDAAEFATTTLDNLIALYENELVR